MHADKEPEHAMKIVAVLGSPRPQSNSSALAYKFLNTARERGAEIKIYPLNQLEYKGCQACRACKINSEACVQKDDLAEVLDAVKGADVLVLASPVYFGDVSGQMKCFIDRTYSYVSADFTTRLAAGKKAVIILVQANPDEKEFSDIFPRYKRFLKSQGFEEVALLRGVGAWEAGDIEQQTAVMDRAAALAREMAG
jgi:multimeric flavodoxin WrbA